VWELLAIFLGQAASRATKKPHIYPHAGTQPVTQLPGQNPTPKNGEIRKNQSPHWAAVVVRNCHATN